MHVPTYVWDITVNCLNGNFQTLSVTFYADSISGPNFIHLLSIKVCINLPAEISKGGVKVSSNNKLCYVDTIEWEREIIRDESQIVEIENASTICKHRLITTIAAIL